MLRRVRSLPLRVVIPWVITALAVTAAIVMFLRYDALEREQARSDEVHETARAFVTELTNFSYQTIEEDVEAIRSYAVGAFAEETEVFFGEEGIAAIREAEAISEGAILSLFVQELADEEASVFAVVEETATNAVSQEPQTDTLRLEVALIETDDGWKVSRVEVFQAPGSGLPLGG